MTVQGRERASKISDKVPVEGEIIKGEHPDTSGSRNSSPSLDSSSGVGDISSSPSSGNYAYNEKDILTTTETFEDLLKICGSGGKWQFKVFLLASFCGFCTALHNLIYAFIGAKPDHWCQLPTVDGILQSDLKEQLIPQKVEDGEFVYEECAHYAYTLSGNQLTVDNTSRLGCDGRWDYNTTTFRSTIMTEFDLVCEEKRYLVVLVQSMYMFGILVGSPIFGALSDQIGRKKTIITATIIFVLAGPLVALSPNFYFLMAARFILAAASPGIYGTSFVLTIEILGPNWRGAAGNLFCLPFAFGYMFLPGVAYFLRDWRNLQYALSAPSLILLVTAFLIPESPRWLLRKGRVEEAEAIMRQAAASNKRTKRLPSTFSNLVKKVGAIEREELSKMSFKRKAYNVLDGFISLLRTPKLRRRVLVIYFCWASISMIYYGIALNSPNLGSNIYLYTFISGVLEIPSYFMVPPLIRLLGRRPVFSGFLLICGISLGCSLIFETGSTMIVALSLFGKLVIGGAYALVYLYATELTPTLLRTYGLGTASTVGRIGSILAPVVVDIVGRENKTYPSIVFAVLSLLAGILSILLPETRDSRLPETVDDIELGKV